MPPGALYALHAWGGMAKAVFFADKSSDDRVFGLFGGLLSFCRGSGF